MLKFITGLSLKDWTLIIVAITSIGLLLYINSLQNAIVDRDKEIVNLNKVIENQNYSISRLGEQRMDLETRLNNVKISNGRLQGVNMQLAEAINRQKPPVDCIEALDRVSSNARSLAIQWNKK